MVAKDYVMEKLARLKRDVMDTENLLAKSSTHWLENDDDLCIAFFEHMEYVKTDLAVVQKVIARLEVKSDDE